ncbi:MAG: four helix bundle suffix domain-containing protein [Fimbriimonadaceae bacterium]|nr:four helix bundle suffix domain-containing protein [Fimbriimonadaceae bacterium]
MDRVNDGLIPRHGGYRNLKSFQVAQLAYDLTVDFVDRYVDSRSRTRDQMVQAARSGVQNIAEGSQVSATSKKMEMKLTSVARASLEELRLDYEDFLRHRKLLQWDRDDARRQRLIDARPRSLDDIDAWIQSISSTLSPEPEIRANAALALIAVATALLTRQIQSQANSFENEGGFTERLCGARKSKR